MDLNGLPRARHPELLGPVLFGLDDTVAEFVQNILRTDLHLGPYTALGVIRDDELVGGVLYHDYYRDVGNIQMTVASTTPRWLSREVIQICMNYPFTELGCRRVTSLVREDNPHAQRFNERLGFILEGRIRQGAGVHGDQLLYGMLKDECRWITRQVH